MIPIMLQFCHFYILPFEYGTLKSPVFRRIGCSVIRWLLYTQPFYIRQKTWKSSKLKQLKWLFVFLYLSCSFQKQSNSCYSWFSSYPQHPIFRHLALRQRVIIFKMKISELLARNITGHIFVIFRLPRKKWCWLTWSSSPAWAVGTRPISPRRKSMTFSGLSKAQISNKGRYSMSVV